MDIIMSTAYGADDYRLILHRVMRPGAFGRFEYVVHHQAPPNAQGVPGERFWGHYYWTYAEAVRHFVARARDKGLLPTCETFEAGGLCESDDGPFSSTCPTCEEWRSRARER